MNRRPLHEVLPRGGGPRHHPTQLVDGGQGRSGYDLWCAARELGCMLLAGVVFGGGYWIYLVLTTSTKGTP